MNKRTKIPLVIAACLVLTGCVILGVVMTILKWDFTKLSIVKYETNDYEISEDYKNISIVTNTADILFLPSENAKSSVVCHEHKNMKHSVTVRDGTLVIEVVNNIKWYENIGINFETPKITVYIPQGEYGILSVKSSTSGVEIPKNFKFESIDISVSTGNVTNYAGAFKDIKIKTTTGSIRAEDIFANSLELSVSTGKVTASNITCEADVTVGVSTGKANLSNITCKKLISSGSTGDFYLNNVIAAEKFSVKRTTGDVKFDGCDAAEIFIETDTGSVKGSLLTEKVFITETDTGSIDVPKAVTGGKCEINTDTGNIKITVK